MQQSKFAPISASIQCFDAFALQLDWHLSIHSFIPLPAFFEHFEVQILPHLPV